MKTKRTHEEIAYKLIAAIGTTLYDRVIDNGRDGLNSAMITVNYCEDFTNQIEQAENLTELLKKAYWTSDEITDFIAWLARGIEPQKIVTRVERWKREDKGVASEVYVEVYYADDSYWQGYVNEARWAVMLEEELYASIDKANTQLLPQESESFEYYVVRPDRFGLCAWCRSYWSRETKSRHSHIMSNEKFEQISGTAGASHGCCPECAMELLNADKVS